MGEPFGNGEIVKYRMGQAEREILELRETEAGHYRELSKKLDRILWALVTTCLTITAALVVFVIQGN